MEIIRYINFSLAILFTVCYFYQFVYVPILWFGKKRYQSRIKPGTPHNFAALICARNESAVITDLIDSLKAQNYSKGSLTIFVLADNCTDNTAELCRNAGVNVYERFNTELVGKGYALSELLSNIGRDYPEDAFDGYFVFDADNILSPDYIDKMNDVFSMDNPIVTSYRNSKNIGDNWLTAGMGLWFLRESRYLNNARVIVGSSCSVSGTGFLFGKVILDEMKQKGEPWPYHLLTEDLEFSIDYIIAGRKIAFAEAELYDEQPRTFKQSWNQRIRWSKGYFQIIRNYGIRAIKTSLKGSFAAFDTIMNIAPAFFISIFSLVCNLTFIILSIVSGQNPLVVLGSFGEMMMNLCLTAFVVGCITTVTEWKHMKTSTARKIWHMFTFPFFMLTFMPVSVAALLKRKVEWKPIKHSVTKKDIEKRGKSEQIFESGDNNTAALETAADNAEAAAQEVADNAVDAAENAAKSAVDTAEAAVDNAVEAAENAAKSAVDTAKSGETDA